MTLGEEHVAPLRKEQLVTIPRQSPTKYSINVAEKAIFDADIQQYAHKKLL